MILFHMLLCYLDNPVTIPQVEKKNVSVPSTNIQFEFETTDKLDEILQTEYGQVCMHYTNCVVYYYYGHWVPVSVHKCIPVSH